MNFHVQVNPTPEIIRAQTEGIDWNNRGCDLLKKGKYAEAEQALHRALEIKLRAYGGDSIHVCISLGVLADIYLAWKKFDQAKLEAVRFLDTATRINSAEQQRLAREVLQEIAQATGTASECGSAHPHRTKQHTMSVSDSSFSIEPPTRRCLNTGCLKTTDLLRCARCRRVTYCSTACQRAAWPEHKKSCVQA